MKAKDEEWDGDEDKGIPDSIGNGPDSIGNGKLYEFHIQVATHHKNGDGYSVYYGKQYGDMLGGARGVKDKDEAIALFKTMKKQWEQHDSICGRISDTVTKKNLDFRTEMPDITVEMLFGNKGLSDWF